jgi:NADPH:quinone reductase-like Zn-dependent oxidoreductase
MGSPREFREMVTLYGEGGLKPVIDRVFPLAQTSEAHRRMDGGEQMGKIVLTIA